MQDTHRDVSKNNNPIFAVLEDIFISNNCTLDPFVNWKHNIALAGVAQLAQRCHMPQKVAALVTGGESTGSSWSTFLSLFLSLSF